MFSSSAPGLQVLVGCGHARGDDVRLRGYELQRLHAEDTPDSVSPLSLYLSIAGTVACPLILFTSCVFLNFSSNRKLKMVARTRRKQQPLSSVVAYTASTGVVRYIQSRLKLALTESLADALSSPHAWLIRRRLSTDIKPVVHINLKPRLGII